VNTTRILRHLNAQRCLRLLRELGSVTRADMARHLGLNRSTTGNAIAELLDAGLVQELDDNQIERGKGRPGVRVALAAEGAYALGVDVGTREISGVLMDLNLGIVARTSVPPGPQVSDAAGMAARVAALAQQLLRDRQPDPARVLGLGVSIPGLVDRAGVVVNAPFLQWRHFDLKVVLAGALPADWRIEVHNDADCFALAELAVSAQGELAHLQVLHLAEGIGSALVFGGKVMRGAHGHAGEIGHTLVLGGAVPRAFEQMAGAAAFAGLVAADAPLNLAVDRLLLQRDEPPVAAALADWADALALGVVNAVHVLDPGRIVLGGALSRLYPLVADRVLAAVQRHLVPGVVPPPIELTSFGPDVAAIGAAAVIREAVFALPQLHAQPQHRSPA
jgi:predicted NBD/HSP70 family sugar kinase